MENFGSVAAWSYTRLIKLQSAIDAGPFRDNIIDGKKEKR